MARLKMAKCPVCEDTFELFPDLDVGATMQCPSCYTELKLIRLSPVEVEESGGGTQLGYYDDEEDDDEDNDKEDSEEERSGDEEEERF